MWGTKLEFSVNVAQCTYDGSSIVKDSPYYLTSPVSQTNGLTECPKNDTHAASDVLEEESSPEKMVLTMFRHNLPDVTSK